MHLRGMPLPLLCRRSTLISFVTLWLATTSPLALAADPTVGATKYGNARFFRFHAEFLERAAKGNVDLLFLGDSITRGWASQGEIWQEAWGEYRPANFGIGGDRTENVIWRIEQGELDKISPRVVVLMIGTNNLASNDVAGIVAGNRRIVDLIQEKLPNAKILLLGVFPRGPRNNWRGEVDPHEEFMRKITEINAELAEWDNGETIRFLDLGPKFTSADGTIANAIMPDQLHLSAAGYEIWVEGMKPLVDTMMAD
ncbi:MAG: hypothetical protein SynsKO_12610 [Synoicihabitans sp.]